MRPYRPARASASSLFTRSTTLKKRPRVCWPIGSGDLLDRVSAQPEEPRAARREAGDLRRARRPQGRHRPGFRRDLAEMPRVHWIRNALRERPASQHYNAGSLPMLSDGYTGISTTLTDVTHCHGPFQRAIDQIHGQSRVATAAGKTTTAAVAEGSRHPPRALGREHRLAVSRPALDQRRHQPKGKQAQGECNSEAYAAQRPPLAAPPLAQIGRQKRRRLNGEVYAHKPPLLLAHRSRSGTYNPCRCFCASVRSGLCWPSSQYDREIGVEAVEIVGEAARGQ